VLARLLGPSVRWVWRRVGLTPRPRLSYGVSLRRDQMGNLSRRRASPVIEFQGASILSPATQTTPSAATLTTDPWVKSGTVIQASRVLKKEPCRSPVSITAFPHSSPLRPLVSTTNTECPTQRLRFSPSLPVHDENSEGHFTPSGPALSSTPRSKSNGRRAQSVPIGARF
jgi:hypothetical protein